MSGLEGLLAGRTLVGRYRIEEVIGRGGFAVVYRAADERLGRPVAVKVVTLAARDEAEHARLREHFQQEARAAASLPQHPNVVTVYDFGTDRELDIDFLAMELLRGEDLATRLKREGRLPTATALRILRDAGEGVAVGHRAGLVHRDVKPGNLFLAEAQSEDEPFRVCVLDFGIARVAAEEATLTRAPGAEGVAITPAYAAPEQFAGGGAMATPAADVFSLAVVGWQMLSGEKLFGEARRADEPWSPPDSAALGATVPAGIGTVLRRALDPDPAARYADADAFAAALDEATRDGTATAYAPPLAAATVPADATVALPPAQPRRRIPRVGTHGERRHARSRGGWLLLPVLALVAFAGWRALSGSGGRRRTDAPAPRERAEASDTTAAAAPATDAPTAYIPGDSAALPPAAEPQSAAVPTPSPAPREPAPTAAPTPSQPATGAQPRMRPPTGPPPDVTRPPTVANPPTLPSEPPPQPQVPRPTTPPPQPAPATPPRPVDPSPAAPRDTIRLEPALPPAPRDTLRLGTPGTRR